MRNDDKAHLQLFFNNSQFIKFEPFFPDFSDQWAIKRYSDIIVMIKLHSKHHEHHIWGSGYPLVGIEVYHSIFGPPMLDMLLTSI